MTKHHTRGRTLPPGAASPTPTRHAPGGLRRLRRLLALRQSPRDSRWDSRFDSRLDFRLSRPWGRHMPITPRLLVDLVDPSRSQVQAVRIWIEGGLLQIAGPLLLRQVPLGQVDWHPSTPRPDGQAPLRSLRLPDGSWLCATDAEAWDQWVHQRDARTPCERLVLKIGRYLWWTLPAAAGGLWWVWRTH